MVEVSSGALTGEGGKWQFDGSEWIEPKGESHG
jgi:hypothetical protein